MANTFVNPTFSPNSLYRPSTFNAEFDDASMYSDNFGFENKFRYQYQYNQFILAYHKVFETACNGKNITEIDNAALKKMLDEDQQLRELAKAAIDAYGEKDVKGLVAPPELAYFAGGQHHQHLRLQDLSAIYNQLKQQAPQAKEQMPFLEEIKKLHWKRSTGLAYIETSENEFGKSSTTVYGATQEQTNAAIRSAMQAQGIPVVTDKADYIARVNRGERACVAETLANGDIQYVFSYGIGQEDANGNRYTPEDKRRLRQEAHKKTLEYVRANLNASFPDFGKVFDNIDKPHRVTTVTLWSHEDNATLRNHLGNSDAFLKAIKPQFDEFNRQNGFASINGTVTAQYHKFMTPEQQAQERQTYRDAIYAIVLEIRNKAEFEEQFSVDDNAAVDNISQQLPDVNQKYKTVTYAQAQLNQQAYVDQIKALAQKFNYTVRERYNHDGKYEAIDIYVPTQDIIGNDNFLNIAYNHLQNPQPVQQITTAYSTPSLQADPANTGPILNALTASQKLNIILKVANEQNLQVQFDEASNTSGMQYSNIKVFKASLSSDPTPDQALIARDFETAINTEMDNMRAQNKDSADWDENDWDDDDSEISTKVSSYTANMRPNDYVRYAAVTQSDVEAFEKIAQNNNYNLIKTPAGNGKFDIAIYKPNRNNSEPTVKNKVTPLYTLTRTTTTLSDADFIKKIAKDYNISENQAQQIACAVAQQCIYQNKPVAIHYSQQPEAVDDTITEHIGQYSITSTDASLKDAFQNDVKARVEQFNPKPKMAPTPNVLARPVVEQVKSKPSPAAGTQPDMSSLMNMMGNAN